MNIELEETADATGRGIKSLMRGTSGAMHAWLMSQLAGEDTDLGRMLVSNGVKWTALQSTAIGSSYLVKAGKTTLVAIIGVAAGTTQTLTPRDNGAATAGGTSFPFGFTNAANTNITDAILKGAEPIFNSGLVIDSTGSVAGTYVVFYK